MIRSSRGGRPPFFSGCAKSSSSERNSSRSRSLIAALVLETNEGSSTFSHALFPGVSGADQRKSTAFLLKPNGSHRQVFRFLWRETRALGCDCRGNLFQAFLAHCLSED